MNLDRLRYFLALAETGNMRKAGEILHVSAPALSKSLKALEGELGTELFRREGRGLALTPEGTKLAQKAGEILKGLAALERELREGAQEDRPLKFGSFEVFSTYFLGELAQEEFKGLPLEMHELGPGRLEEGLLNGQVDFALTYLPIPKAGLKFLKIGEVSMGAFAASTELGRLPFEEWPFAVPLADAGTVPTKAHGLDGWPDDKVPRKVVYKVAMMESAMELCRRGLAVAYLPRFVASLHNRNAGPKARLQELPLPRKFPANKQAAYLAIRQQDAEGPVAKKLARALRRVLEEK